MANPKTQIKKNLQNQNNDDTTSSDTSSLAPLASRPVTAPLGAPLNDSSRAQRPQRIPLSEQKRMDAPERPGFKRRWINDKDGRLERAMRGGYTVVEGDFAMSEQSKVPGRLGSQTRMSVSMRDGVQAVLMEIPEDVYEDDQRNKIKNNSELVNEVNDLRGKHLTSYVNSVQVEQKSTQ